MHPTAQLASMNEDQEVCSETLRVPHCAHFFTTDACDVSDNVQCSLCRSRFTRLLVGPHLHSHTKYVSRELYRTDIRRLQVESKLFYLDLKRNARGRYLKIAEKGTNRERSTIIVPCTGIMWFRELFNYYAGGTNEQG